MYVEALKSALEVLRYKLEARFFPSQALPTERETSHRSPSKREPALPDKSWKGCSNHSQQTGCSTSDEGRRHGGESG